MTDPWSKTGYKLPVDHWGWGKKGKTNLRNAEVGKQEAPGAGGSPYEEHLDLETSRAGFFVD